MWLQSGWGPVKASFLLLPEDPLPSEAEFLWPPEAGPILAAQVLLPWLWGSSRLPYASCSQALPRPPSVLPGTLGLWACTFAAPSSCGTLAFQGSVQCLLLGTREDTASQARLGQAPRVWTTEPLLEGMPAVSLRGARPVFTAVSSWGRGLAGSPELPAARALAGRGAG